MGKVVTISQAEKDRFAKLFDDGLTYKGLANEFNRAVETMRAWRRRLGLPPRQRKGFPSQNKHYTGFYLDAETEAKLVYVARRAGITKSEFLRRLLQRKLQGVTINGKTNNARSLQGHSRAT